MSMSDICAMEKNVIRLDSELLPEWENETKNCLVYIKASRFARNSMLATFKKLFLS